VKRDRRRIYFAKHNLDEARDIAVACARQAGPLESETVPVAESLGRVAAEPVVARFSVPIADVSAMDGLAVKSESVLGASESNPIVLRLEQDARLIDTGQPVPPGCDTVVMIEHAELRDDGTVVFTSSARPWQNVRLAGEDVAAGETVIDEGTRIRPIDQGAMQAVGVTEVRVYCQPTVGIMPTGDEVVAPGSEPEPGQLVEFNSIVLAGMVREWGGRTVVFPAVKDDPELLYTGVADAVRDCAVLLIIGGSSAGRHDFVQQTLAALGEVRVEAVAIAPGKPTAIGVIDRTPVLGMPGYPVSCVVAAQQFLRPMLATMLRTPEPSPQRLPTRFARKVPSKLGQEEFIRVRLNPEHDGGVVACPMPRGAGAVTSVARADGVVRIPPQAEGIAPAEPCEAELLRPWRPVAEHLVIAGCWDPAIDLLIRLIREQDPEITVLQDHIGSLAGLDALHRRETAFAACAIPLDPADEPLISGDLLHALAQNPNAFTFITLCTRQYGLVVLPDNPKHITTLADLARPDVTFANRRRGSTARHSLDSALAAHGIDPHEIRGYSREYKTDLAAAASVKASLADVAFGAAAAAERLGLDCIHAGKEALYLVTPATDPHPLSHLVAAAITNSQYCHAIPCASSGHDPALCGLYFTSSELLESR